MKPTCDCIIPFYNEGERVFAVVRALSQVPLIGNIICVDDGSNDHVEIPNVTLLRLPRNIGKSQAVFAGLRLVKCETVLLFDGDLVGVQPAEIESVSNTFFDRSLDMVILKANGEKKYKIMDDLFRNYIVQSGNRIMKTNDLFSVETLHPIGYQLEVAINQYMLDKKKTVAWYPISALNLHKTEKLSFVDGWKKDITMDREIMSYLGPIKRLQQILFFCRRKIVI